MKFIEVTWPDIQNYMEHPRWKEVGFDPDKNTWYVPEDMLQSRNK